MAPKEETSAEERTKTNRATRKRVALIFYHNGTLCELTNNLELGEFQQQLFGARVAELDGSLGVLARTLDLHHLTNAKTLMLDGAALTEF